MLAIRPLWFSFGPNTLKNFSPAHPFGPGAPGFETIENPAVELVLALAVQVQRPESPGVVSSSKPSEPSP